MDRESQGFMDWLRDKSLRGLAGEAAAFRAGEALPPGLFLVTEGCIKLVQPRGCKRFDRVIDWFGPGMLVGWEQPLRGTSSLVAYAVRDSKALPMQPYALVSYNAEDALAQLATMLSRAYEVQRELMCLETPQRLARALLRLAGNSALAETKGNSATLRLRHEDLASYTGISRETVSTVLGRWRRHGVVKTGRVMLLVDLGKLRALGAQTA